MTIHKVLTNKQQTVLQSYLHDDWRVMILSGAVRAGKTYISDWLFLMEIRRVAKMAKKRHDPHPIVILAGYSSNSIYTNVIASIESEFGIEFKTDRHGHYRFRQVDIVPVYTGNKRGVGAIRGATAYSAYIDEGSLADQSVFQEILQRCSVKGSRVIVTTNPGNPSHFLKADYIDKAGDPKARIKEFNFVIDDNAFLPAEYVTALKAQTPSGMFYKRSILGLWVSGEGSVYKDFDERKMVKPDDEATQFTRYVAGLDWGYDHYGSIVVFGVDDQDRWWLVEEHSEQYKEVPYWTDIAKSIQAKYGRNIPFYCDSARTEHIDHLKHAGINAQLGWKSVVPGIEIVASLMKQGRFFIKKSAPVRFLKEIYNYRWDPKKPDAVIKENDDCMDACRYAIATDIHLHEIKTYHPASNNRQSIINGMKRLGLS